MNAAVVLLVVLVVFLATPALAGWPPSDPTNPIECYAAGGKCVASDACRDWRKPFKGICGVGRECCFKDTSEHRLRCGVFDGECAPAHRCGNAPRNKNAYCPKKGQVCCIWLY